MISGRLTKPGSPLTASMYRDLQRGAPVECDAILGDLIERGRLRGINAPFLQAAYAQLSVYESLRTRPAPPDSTADPQPTPQPNPPSEPFMRSIGPCTTAILSALLLSAAGCKVEKLSTVPATSRTSSSPAVQAPAPANAQQDDAQLLLQACGRPRRDQIVQEHNKLHDTVVRKLVYNGREAVTIELIPSQAAANLLPPNVIWRFSDALMEDQTLLTARDLDPFLPCATRALAHEY